MKNFIILSIAILLVNVSLAQQSQPISLGSNTGNYNVKAPDTFKENPVLDYKSVKSQKSNSSIIQDFESGIFPPDGWATFSPTGSGVWEQPFIFDLATRGNFAIMSPTDGGIAWLVSPQLIIPEGELLSFFATDSFTDTGQNLSVMISTNDDRLDTSSYTLLRTILEEEVYEAHSSFSAFNVDVSAFEGQEVFIAFVYNDQINTDFWVIDDIHFAACEPVTNLSGYNATESTIELSWDGNADSYTIEYGLSQIGGFPIGSGTTIEATGNSHEITGLQELEFYEFFVTSNCQDDQVSLPSGHIRTKTDREDCDPITTFPYFEGFEGIQFSDELSCMTIKNNRNKNGGLSGESLLSSQNFFSIVQIPDLAFEGDASLGMSFFAPGFQWMIAPPVVVPNDGLFFRFAMRYSSLNGNFSKVHVNVFDFENETWDVVRTFEDEDDVNLFERLEDIDLSSYANKVIKVAIVHEQTGIGEGNFGEAFFVDNIEYSTETLSVNNSSLLEFEIYPNPVSTNLNIKSNSIIDNIRVFNLLGQVISEEETNTKQLNLDLIAWKSGVYFFEISSNDRTVVKKVIKE